MQTGKVHQGRVIKGLSKNQLTGGETYLVIFRSERVEAVWDDGWFWVNGRPFAHHDDGNRIGSCLPIKRVQHRRK